jgi:hypothetical protein
MFAFEYARPPTRAEKKAIRLYSNCENYIFYSTDSTSVYLEESMKWIEGIAPVLDKTEGQGTTTIGMYKTLNEYLFMIQRVIRWLQANRSLSSQEIKRKYPTLISDGLRELKRKDSMMHQVDRQLPNLLSRVIHRDRLGDAIDEVLGLTGTPEASTYRDCAKARPARRYGSKP